MIHTCADGTVVDVQKIATIDPVICDFGNQPSYSFCVTFDGGAEVIIPPKYTQRHHTRSDGKVVSMFHHYSYAEVEAMREKLVQHFGALP